MKTIGRYFPKIYFSGA